MLQLVLASSSPRRRELLGEAGYPFTLSPVKVSEIFSESLNAREVVSHLATVKARACLDQHKHLNTPDYLILGADTLVVLPVDGGDQILGKPADEAQALDYLTRLSGGTHCVMTGVCLLRPGTSEVWTGVDVTEVEFRPTTEAELRAYVATGEPMDKAGAYAIQGGARNFISTFKGSWSNVVGLPLERLEKALEENGWNVGRRPLAKD